MSTQEMKDLIASLSEEERQWLREILNTAETLKGENSSDDPNQQMLHKVEDAPPTFSTSHPEIGEPK